MYPTGSKGEAESLASVARTRHEHLLTALRGAAKEVKEHDCTVRRNADSRRQELRALLLRFVPSIVNSEVLGEETVATIEKMYAQEH